MRYHHPKNDADTSPSRHWEPLCEKVPRTHAAMTNAPDQVTCKWCLKKLASEHKGEAKDG